MLVDDNDDDDNGDGGASFDSLSLCIYVFNFGILEFKINIIVYCATQSTNETKSTYSER